MALASSVAAGLGQHVRDLSDQRWSLSSTSDTFNLTVPASFPSQADLDLFKAGVINDPYYRLNDFNLRWIADSNWTYTSDPILDLLNDYESTWLVFEGLDTFATISFCGDFIASTDNQFRQYAFNVSSALKQCKGNPAVSINVGSVPKIVDAIASDPSSEKWPVQLINEYSNSWLMRKEQSDFGWDWGPAFAPAGPWKPGHIVQLESPGNIHVLNTDFDIYRKGQINHLPHDQGQPWVVNASIDFVGFLPPHPRLSINIEDVEYGTVLATRPLDNVNICESSITGITVLEGLNPRLWWPSGMGDQNLYNIKIVIHDSQNEPLTSVTKRTGFRTIFLNQRNITEQQLAKGIAGGANWHFEVNGKEFYAKGSNLIPPDAFWPRVTKNKMTRLFDAVIAGNQNMIRVWSSGAYLHDYIYDLADERGILLWSEFQFSDAMYPVNDEFLENVAEEVVYNVRRVNHHPSLALWAGGNEIESLMLPLTKAADPDGIIKYVDEYEKLYISLILPLLYENTRSISYTPSSTTKGYIDVNLSAPVPMKERFGNLEPGFYYGDTDYYEYDTKVSFDYSLYPIGRFANEFGFHNNFHNTSIGMGEMTMGVERYYPIPNKSDSVANFSAWCHATQLFQADVYKSQIQFYRRGSGMPERQLGSLYWQLEDIWQAPTWAGIEYDGRWKVLHYVGRDIYKPIIVSPFWNYTTGDLEIYVTSDLWAPANGTVKLTWLDLSGHPIAHNAGTPDSLSFNVGAINTTKIYNTNMRGLRLSDPKNSIILLSLSGMGNLPNRDETTTFTRENHFTPVFPKDLRIVDPQVELSYDVSTRLFTVEAKSGVSLYTWLDYPTGLVGYFQQNAFVLVPGERKQVGFVIQEDNTNGPWRQEVTVRSLWDQKTSK